MSLEKYKPEDFYRFGQEGLNQKQMGAFYETSNIRISQVLINRPDLKNALERGRKNLPFSDSEIDFAEMIGIEETENLPDKKGKAKIREAIEKKIYFCAEIAEFANLDRRDCYVLLTEMVKAGELVRHDGGSVSYSFPRTVAVIEPDDETVTTPLSYKGLTTREKVLKAVRGGNHLSRQICAATGLSIGEVLHEIEKLDYESEENGVPPVLFTRRELSFRAYFVAENLPPEDAKLRLDKGTLKIINPEKKPVAPEVWAQKEKELEEMNKNPKPYIPPVSTPLPEDVEEFEEEIFTDQKEIKQVSNKSNITVETVEEWARQGLPVAELERKLGFYPNKIHALFQKHKDLKAVYQKVQKDNGIKPQIKGKMSYTVEMFEDWGKQGLTQAAIGKLVGKNASAIHMAMRSSPERAAAYKRGLAIFKTENQTEEKESESSFSAKQTPKIPYSEIPVTKQEDEAFQEIESSLAKEVFEQIVEPVLQESEDESDEEIDEFIDEAFKNLRTEKTTDFQHQIDEMFGGDSGQPPQPSHWTETPLDKIMVNPRFAHQLEHVSENGHSKEGIERKKKEFLDSLPQISFRAELTEKTPPQTQKKTVKLSNGKTISVETDGNVFDLTDEEFALIGGIRLLIQGFGKQKGEIMLKINRVESGKPNYLVIETPDGSITITGTNEFFTRMVKDLLRHGSEFEKEFRAQLEGVTKEDFAEQLRNAGFPEKVVQDFEKAEPEIER